MYQFSVAKEKTESPNSALKRGAAVTEQSSLISSETHTLSLADFLESVKTLQLKSACIINKKVEVVHRQQMQMPLQERPKRTVEAPLIIVYPILPKMSIKNQKTLPTVRQI